MSSLPLGREYHGIIAAVDYLGLLGAQPTGGQTTGGTHATNSEHYAGRAVDFGVATQGGGEALIQDIYDALLPYAIGGGHVIDELFWQDQGWADGVEIGLVGGHYDHVHVGVKPTIDLLFEVSSGSGVTDPDAGGGLGGGGDPFDDSGTGWAVREGTTVGVTPTTEDGFQVYRKYVTVGVVPAGGVFIALQLTDGTYVEMDAYSCALGDIVIYGDDYEVGVVSEGEVNTDGWMHLGGPLSFVFTSYDEEVTFLWGWSSAVWDTDSGHWIDTGPGEWVTLTQGFGSDDNIAVALDAGGVGSQQITYPGDPLPFFIPPSYWSLGGPEEDLDYAAYLAARAGADDNSNTPPGVGQQGSWVSGGLAYGVTYTTGLSEEAGFIDLTGPLYDLPEGTLPGPDGAWGVVDENGSAIILNDIRDIVLYVEAADYENTSSNSTLSVQIRNLAFDYPQQNVVDDEGNLAVDRYMLTGGDIIAGWQTVRGDVLAEFTPSEGSQHALSLPDPVPTNLVQDPFNGHWVWPFYLISTHTVDAEAPAPAGYDDYDVLLGGARTVSAYAVLGPYGDRISLQYRRPALRWFMGFWWNPPGEVFPRRWRQRDDGLGASGARWRGRTSMQESNRWKGYL